MCRWKPYHKTVRLQGYFLTLTLDSGMASLRPRENLSLLQLFAGNSRFICFQTGDCTIIYLFVLFSVCAFCCLSSGKETASVCATNMAFPWMLGRSINWQSSSPSSSKGPGPFFDSVRLSDQLLQESSGRAEWNQRIVDFIGLLHRLHVETDRIIGLNLIVDQTVFRQPVDRHQSNQQIDTLFHVRTFSRF